MRLASRISRLFSRITDEEVSQNKHREGPWVIPEASNATTCYDLAFQPLKPEFPQP